MVFSQTSHKTQSILKVVELDRLKPEKSQQVNDGSYEVSTDTNAGATQPSAMANTSFTEVYLKTEPESETKMFHEDCEFFQDLVPWCSGPAKDEQVQTIDSAKVTEERTFNTDTLHTLFSPQGWDAFDVNSPVAQAGFYSTTPSLSPNIDAYNMSTDKFQYPSEEIKMPSQEQFLDISSLPVVIGDLQSEMLIDTNPWPSSETVDWVNTHNTDYTKTNTNTFNTPFFEQEDSLDLKLLTTVKPRDVETNDVVISEYIINSDMSNNGIGQLEESKPVSKHGGLTVDVAARAPSWPSDVISTPEVLSYVEQLEKEKCPAPISEQWQAADTGFVSTDTCPMTSVTPPMEYEPITPKSESHVESDNDDVKSRSSKRRRHDSEDSDETYTPYSERTSTTTRKYKRRANIPINEMIRKLQGSQQLTKARRGRPPKRRESTVSSVCSVDETASNISTQELKYRELRDKNNEASKRSRMNRKLKELQMEQMADQLEERNKKLKVRADILEDMTKKLKKVLMSAILQK